MAKTVLEIYKRSMCSARRRTPHKLWDNCSESDLVGVIRYLIIEELGMNRNDVLENVSMGFLHTYKLRRAVEKNATSDTRSFIIDCFPEWNIKPWEFKRSSVPVNFWDDENVAYATRWLIEDVLKWDSETVQLNITNVHFRKNGLGGMLEARGMNATDAIVLAYSESNWSDLKKKKNERAGKKVLKNQVAEILQHHRNGKSMFDIKDMYDLDMETIFKIIYK